MTATLPGLPAARSVRSIVAARHCAESAVEPPSRAPCANDRIDAKLLALFAQHEQPPPRPRLDAETQTLPELATRRDQLVEMRVAEQQTDGMLEINRSEV